MASLVLGGLGSALGGPIGGMIGGMLGGLIDSHLFKPKTQYGPTLTDLSVTSATYGQPLPIVYGTTRIAGNLMDASNLVSHTNTVGGGKGGGGGAKQVTYTYTCTFAVGICAGPITKIWRIWADGLVIIDWRPPSVYNSAAGESPQITYNTAAPWTDYVTVYTGTEDQMPDPSLESIHGAGKTPAYRGVAYIACSNFPVTPFGNRIPNFTFEVVGEVTTQPQLTYNDDFQAKNSYFSGASTVAQGYAPSSVDQYGNFILTGGNGTSAGISQTGATSWTKTSTALATELINAAYPSFTVSSVSNPGMVAVANGQYLLGFASVADVGLNETRFFVGVYVPNSTGPPTFKGAIVIGSGIYATGWPYNGTIFGVTVAGAQTTEDPILAIGAQGIGGTTYYIGVMPSIASIMGGSQAVQNAQATAQGLPISQGLCALLGPITTYLPQKGAFAVPYLTVSVASIFAASQPVPVIGTQIVFLFTKTEIANNTGGTACPLMTTYGNDLHPDGAAVMYDLGVLTMPQFLPPTITAAPLSGSLAPQDYGSIMGLPWPDAGTYLSTSAIGSTDDYQPTPALVWQTMQSQSGTGIMYGWVMAGDEDMATNRSNLSELAAVRILVYDPILKTWTPWSYSTGEILSAADIGGTSSNFQNNSFVIYSSPTGAVVSGAVNDLILGGSLQGNSSHGGGYTYWTALGGLNGTWGCGLDAIVLDICKRAGIPATEVDVTPLSTQIVDGYCITHQMPGRTAIESLQQAFFFDGVESDWIIKFKFRTGTPIGSISANDLGARQDSIEQDVTPVTEIRQGNADLPRGVVIKYMLASIWYQTATQQAKRPLPAIFTNQLTTYDLAITMQPADAKAAAEKALYLAWINRTSYHLVLPRTVLTYDPGDVVTLNYNDADGNGIAATVYLESMDFGANDTINVTGLATDAAVFTTALPSSFPTPSVTGNLNLSQGIRYWLMDIPLLRDIDDSPGFYAAATGLSNAAWTGGPLTQSLDGGSTFTQIDQFTGPSFGGSAVTSLPAPAGNDYSLWDETSTVTVTMLTPFMLLNSTSPDSVMTGNNVAMLGEELIGFANVTEIGPQLYQLSLLRRGMQGSDWAMGSHTVGEPFVLIQGGDTLSETLQLSQLGLALKYEAYSYGAVTDSITPSTMVCEGVRIKPLSPINASFTRSGTPPGAATLNPADLSDVTLSNGNLTGTFTNQFAGVRSTTSQTSGKFYIEFDLGANVGTGTEVGIANAASNFYGGSGKYLGNDKNSVGFAGDQTSGGYAGAVFFNGAALGGSGSDTTTGVWQIAVDLTGLLIWVANSGGLWNSSAIANPATGTGGLSISTINAGPYFAAIGQGGISGDTATLTVNFGQSAFSYPIPAGFAAWNGAPQALTLAWTPRRRYSDDIVDGLDQYIDEPVESYQINVLPYGLPAIATFDPSFNSGTLSNGNLTLTKTSLGTTGASRGLGALGIAGKALAYMEFLVAPTSGSGALVDIGIASASYVDTDRLGQDAASLAYDGLGYIAWNSTGILGSLDTFGATPSVIGMAVNLETGMIWFRGSSGLWNSSATADPVAGIGGVAIPPVMLGGAVFAAASIHPSTAGSSITVNFGNSPFMSPVPESYLPWTACPGFAVRSIAASTPTASYTAAQQTADGLIVGQPISVNIFQISNRVGLGYPGSFKG